MSAVRLWTCTGVLSTVISSSCVQCTYFRELVIRIIYTGNLSRELGVGDVMCGIKLV